MPGLKLVLAHSVNKKIVQETLVRIDVLVQEYGISLLKDAFAKILQQV